MQRKAISYKKSLQIFCKLVHCLERCKWIDLYLFGKDKNMRNKICLQRKRMSISKKFSFKSY